MRLLILHQLQPHAISILELETTLFAESPHRRSFRTGLDEPLEDLPAILLTRRFDLWVLCVFCARHYFANAHQVQDQTISLSCAQLSACLSDCCESISRLLPRSLAAQIRPLKSNLSGTFDRSPSSVQLATEFRCVEPTIAPDEKGDCKRSDDVPRRAEPTPSGSRPSFQEAR